MPWYWTLVAFIGGALIGMVLTALIAAQGRDDD
jgi:purine-cytosine permease-like protein